MKKPNHPGFAALASVIVISALLLTATLALGQAAFNARLNIADAENQAVSEALAKSCAHRVLLDLALGRTETGAITVDASATPPTACLIRDAAENPPGIYVVHTTGEWPARGAHRAATELEVTARASDLTILSWQELPGCPARAPPESCE
jgi:hypothetical protein